MNWRRCARLILQSKKQLVTDMNSIVGSQFG